MHSSRLRGSAQPKACAVAHDLARCRLRRRSSGRDLDAREWAESTARVTRRDRAGVAKRAVLRRFRARERVLVGGGKRVGSRRDSQPRRVRGAVPLAAEVGRKPTAVPAFAVRARSGRARRRDASSGCRRVRVAPHPFVVRPRRGHRLVARAAQRRERGRCERGRCEREVAARLECGRAPEPRHSARGARAVAASSTRTSAPRDNCGSGLPPRCSSPGTTSAPR